MATWNSVKYRKKQVLNSLGDGENTGLPPFDIKDTETTYSRNMDSRKYPSASVRPPRSTFASANSTSVNAIGQRGNSALHVVDGNTWKYWVPASSAYTNLTTTLTANAPGRFAEFVDSTTRYTILMNSTQKLIWDGNSTAIVLGDANTPFTDKCAVHKGRIYALQGASIKYCGLNKTSDWTTASDAGSITITEAKGDGSGIAEYSDKVIAFTEHSMHELHGTGPTNYTLINVEGEIGCISHRSIAKCNGRLYWLDFDGVFEYDGSRPTKVSGAVDEYIKDINLTHKSKCVAGATGDILYLSIVYGSNATECNLILKFDTRLRKWYVENGSFKDFTTIGNTLYGVDVNGQIWNMRDESATEGFDSAIPISWDMITKPYNDMAIGEKKVIDEMFIVTEVSTGSTSFNVGYSTNVFNNDSTTFTTLKSLSGSSDMQDERIKIHVTDLQNVNWYRLRLSGTGDATIHYLQKNIRVKQR